MDGLKSLVEVLRVASRDKVRLIKRDGTADGVEDFVSRPPSNLLGWGISSGGVRQRRRNKGYTLPAPGPRSPFIISVQPTVF